MSLYNMLYGKNPNSHFLLSMLGLTENDCGRFRDCYVTEEDGTRKIVVYTRNGGGNREVYQQVIDLLAEHANYIRDYDDDFDSTYAYIEFSVPEKFKEAIDTLYDETQDKRTPAEKWQYMLNALQKNDTSDPEVQHALEVGKAIFNQIETASKLHDHAGEVMQIMVDGNAPGERGGTQQ